MKNASGEVPNSVEIPKTGLFAWNGSSGIQVSDTWPGSVGTTKLCSGERCFSRGCVEHSQFVAKVPFDNQSLEQKPNGVEVVSRRLFNREAIGVKLPFTLLFQYT